MSKFRKIYVEITTFCGLDCAFCEPKKQPRAVMDLELFSRIAEQIAPHTKALALHILGDPLSVENLREFLDLAQNDVELTSSGFYLSEQKINLILTHPRVRQINISLTAALQQRRDVDLSAYLAGVFALCKQHQQLFGARQNQLPGVRFEAPFINLRLWNLDADFSPPAANMTIYDALKLHFGVQINAKKTRLAEKILLNGARSFSWPSEKNTPKLSGFCHGGSAQLGVLNSGIVVPCCFDTCGQINLGDLRTQSFKEILSSPKLAALCDGFAQNERKFPLCQRCRYPEYLSF